MRRQPDAAAHHDAVHEGYVGLGELRDAGVENVLLAPQHLAEIAPRLGALIERADIAAGAQAALARPLQHDHGDGRVGLEPVERLLDVAKHLQRHRIDRLRPVQPDDAGRTFPPGNQVGFGSGRVHHRAPSISLRETINRMISLVPSRI
jgi:hypothetical protein